MMTELELQQNLQPDTELPTIENPSVQSPAIGADARDVRGRFAAGNTAALVHGGRSRQASALQAPLREEIRRQVMQDLGDDEVALPTTLLRLVDRFAETSLLCDSYIQWLEEQGGPIGTRGRQRAAVGGYLAALDRQMKLAQMIGLERRAKDINTLTASEYLARQRHREGR
jgi:hypothetical protein